MMKSYAHPSFTREQWVASASSSVEESLGGSLASIWTGCSSGKSMDIPGVVRNPLPLLHFRQKDRFSTPLVEKPPAPAAVHRTVFVFFFFLFFQVEEHHPASCRRAGSRHPALSLAFIYCYWPLYPFCY